MHILKNTNPIAMHYVTTLAPGEWLVQDTNAFELALLAERGTCELEHWSPGDKQFIQNPEPNYSWVKSILLIRSGAIGDLLLLTPAIKELRSKYPKAQIWLSCFKKHWDIFAQGDTHFVEYPHPASELAMYDLIIPLENVLELATEKGVHATDAFAEALGVTVTDYKPVYRMTAEEMTWINEDFQKRHIEAAERIEIPKRRVGLQLRSSSIVRDYPLQLWMQVIGKLIAHDWEVMLLGAKDGITNAPAAVKDCSKLSFRDSAAVLATCDVFCGVDSSFFNLCPALGVPAIGLFGPVDWRTRVKEGSGQFAISGVGECAPCGWMNSRAGLRFPPGGPCAKSGRCEPLAAISPDRIVAKIEGAAKK